MRFWISPTSWSWVNVVGATPAAGTEDRNRYGRQIEEAFEHAAKLAGSNLAPTEFYEQRLKLIEAYDQAGIRTYHCAERHSTPLGIAPAPRLRRDPDPTRLPPPRARTRPFPRPAR